MTETATDVERLEAREHIDGIGVQQRDGLELPVEYRLDATSWWSRFLHDRLLDEPGLGGELRVADMYCSVGGLSLGVQVACSLLGRRFAAEAAADTDLDALHVYVENFGPRVAVNASVRDLVDFKITEDESTGRYRFRYTAAIDEACAFRPPSLLVGGPPCQGHSSLNNRTRSDDPKNQLFLTMPALAVAFDVPAVVIENVPNVLNDSRKVVEVAEQLFESHGYSVSRLVVSADSLGWPQTRKRFFLVARRSADPLPVDDVISAIAMEPRDLAWAIADLLDVPLKDGDLIDSTPQLSPDNERRVRWLFENDSYELPNHERPKCHQDGHTYPSVYGRLHWDSPAPTITGGFLSPGRGRYIHPQRHRVLTPHEAARIQGFPDRFSFQSERGAPLKRSHLAKWIGDAVPPILGAVAVISAIG
jgi:DNA (cytosine-5)-methyltransferase 1